MSRITLTSSPDGLALVSPYDPGFVAAFNAAVPRDKKKWDKPNRRWLIDPAYGSAVADLCYTFFGERPRVPLTVALLQPTTRVIKLEYLARCKDHGDGDSAANGWVDDGWNVRFPESVLRDWFHAAAPSGPSAREEQPSATKAGTPATLYAVLGAAQDAAPHALKTNWRRLIMQWHPDHCREPNARAMFDQIQAAYDLLRDPARRKRYDAGLRLQATLIPTSQPASQPRVDLQTMLDAYDPYGYRAPLRCGLLIVEGNPKLGRFLVSAIKQWDEITDARGRVMVSSWPEGADIFEVEWVCPNNF